MTKVEKTDASLENKIHDTTTLIHINQYNTDRQISEKKNGDVDKKVPAV